MAGFSFGCCAPELQGDDDARQLRRSGSAPEDDLILCYEQPHCMEQPLMVPANPSPITAKSVDHNTSWISSGYNLVARASSRVSLSSSTRLRTSFSRSSPSISGPPDARRGDRTVNRKRKSFRPLELTIYLPNNRLSPLPNFNTSDWDRTPAELAFPAQALIRPRIDSLHSETPDSFCVSTDPSEIPDLAPPIPLKSPRRPNTAQAPLHPAVLRRTSPRSSLAPSSRCSSRAPSPARPRANTEPTNAVKQRASSRRNKSDVDEAIRELNTIVEERRLDAFRASQSTPEPNCHHIPAIAPSLRMTVRSETLSDIGSALSVPLASKPLPSVPASPDPGSTTSTTTPTIGPDPPYLHDTGSETSLIDPPTHRSSRSRLSHWFRRSLPSSPTTKPTPIPPFYQCTSPSAIRTNQPHSHSHHSASVSTLCTVSTMHTSPPPSLSEGSTTRTTTSVSQASSSRPSLQKSRSGALSMRRQRKRGLSVASGVSQMTVPPPAYQEVDPHPNSPRTPGIGLAY
ncbi:hypothetical protein W97_02912 [Coniosporium apollinis CBS 100218]|uniref:Uncharacterized protein n=1 Tax=Coniosporium apollinis (strain CBS 100218) TaxID=1168221 RepID=R7YPF3_CONA1|nr:uncharacterized protein W97_02912 [Coniosporium apollinis CBS 100218]EON63684.1 hypothetical protein W97_02912 [Coniosporium apollinis CBS 100218]